VCVCRSVALPSLLLSDNGGRFGTVGLATEGYAAQVKVLGRISSVLALGRECAGRDDRGVEEHSVVILSLPAVVGVWSW
jgi:hypothetical protein